MERILILAPSLVIAAALAGIAVFYVVLTTGGEPDEGFLGWLCCGSFCAMFVIFLAGGIWMLRCSRGAAQKLDLWDGEDYEVIEEADLRIDAGLFIGRFLPISAMISFLIDLFLLKEWQQDDTILRYVNLVILYWLPWVLVGRGYDELKKSAGRLYPQKTGDVYDSAAEGFWLVMNLTFYCERSRLRRRGISEALD